MYIDLYIKYINKIDIYFFMRKKTSFFMSQFRMRNSMRFSYEILRENVVRVNTKYFSIHLPLPKLYFTEIIVHFYTYLMYTHRFTCEVLQHSKEQMTQRNKIIA